MRTYALIALMAGIGGFLYASGRLRDAEPMPPDIPLGEYTRYEAGRWELVRYACAGIGGIGALFAMFPQGR
jgi:hypothetical protein